MIERWIILTVVAMCLAISACTSAPSHDAGARAGHETSAAAVELTLLDAAVRFIEPFEGRRHQVYRDTTGHATIGVGFNLDRAGAAADLAELLPGVDRRALRRGRQTLTDAQIDILLRHDVRQAIDVARRYVANLDQLPRQAQLVLIDMSFNMGSLADWHDLRGAVAEADFVAAASAMRDSRWRHQTGRRAEHLIALMQSLSKQG